MMAVLFMMATFILASPINCEANYAIGSLTSVVEVTDDCYVNIVESFLVTNNQVDKEVGYFSRFISNVEGNVDIVARSVIATSITKKIVNTTIVKSGQYFEIAVYLDTPISKAGSDAFTLNYQMSGPLVAQETVSVMDLIVKFATFILG